MRMIQFDNIGMAQTLQDLYLVLEHF